LVLPRIRNSYNVNGIRECGVTVADSPIRMGEAMLEALRKDGLSVP